MQITYNRIWVPIMNFSSASSSQPFSFQLAFYFFVCRENLNSRNITYHDKESFVVKSQKVCMKCQQSNILYRGTASNAMFSSYNVETKKRHHLSTINRYIHTIHICSLNTKRTIELTNIGTYFTLIYKLHSNLSLCKA